MRPRCDDVDVDMYLDLVSGEANSIGAVYKARTTPSSRGLGA